MLIRLKAPVVLSLLMAVTPLGAVNGQGDQESPVRIKGPTVSGARVAFHRETASQSRTSGGFESQPPGPSGKSVGGAVALSALMPGVGSWYAGNNAHGWRHFGIHVAASVLLAVGVGDTICENDACSTERGGTFVPGAVAYVGNWIWGMVTAAHDANARNQAVTTGK